MKARIEGVDEAIARVDVLAVTLLHLGQRGEHDLGRERDRAAGGGRYDRAVVGDVVLARAARGIAVKLALLVAVHHDHIAGSVARREAPHVLAVAGPSAWVGDRVGTLRV